MPRQPARHIVPRQAARPEEQGRQGAPQSPIEMEQAFNSIDDDVHDMAMVIAGVLAAVGTKPSVQFGVTVQTFLSRFGNKRLVPAEKRSQTVQGQQFNFFHASVSPVRKCPPQGELRRAFCKAVSAEIR